MKTRLFSLAFLSLSLIIVLVSCNKEPDVTEQYMRGGNSLVVAPDGNVVVAGYTSSGTKGYEALLIKANASNGDTLWTKKFGNPYSDAFYSIKNAHKGGFVAAGFSNRANGSSPSMLVVITDANGNAVKTKTYGGSAYSQAFSVEPAADSGYVVAGYIQKTSTSDRDIYLIKINNASDTLWTRSIGAKSTNQNDSVNDAAFGVVAAADGGYFLTGTLNGYTSNGGRIFLMKVSSTGHQLWTKTYAMGIGFSLTLTGDNGIAISGSLQEGSSQDIILIKTDADGNLLWKKTYGGTGYEYGASLVETSDGGFAISGITDSKGFGLEDVYLIRTNSSGDSQWEKTYGGADIDQGFGLVKMPDNGFCITGLSNTDGSYIFLNRTSSDGSQGWAKYIQ